jgi:hypothetical protein
VDKKNDGTQHQPKLLSSTGATEVKLIFSRKGFDSQYGRVPSPILPDGSLQTFPIPSAHGRPLRDISCGSHALHKLAEDLTRGAVNANTSVHLDPDLQAGSVSRRSGWRPSLGQVAAAQQHLRKQGVGPGDVFLFFGWFRHAEQVGGRWQYVREAPGVHALFGWLQVGSMHKVGDGPSPDWLHDHPHVQHAARIGMDNTVYVAGDSVAGSAGSLPAAGTFKDWGPDLQLTAQGATRSIWRVPRWLLKDPQRPGLSYHGDPGRWSVERDSCLLQTVGKGQEFVIDMGDCGEASHWLQALVGRHGAPAAQGSAT